MTRSFILLFALVAVAWGGGGTSTESASEAGSSAVDTGLVRIEVK